MSVEADTTTQMSQQQLEATLWRAANSLRGPVDPGDFKAYVFPVMFFKWICDTHDYHHARAVEDFGDELTDDIEADVRRMNAFIEDRVREVPEQYHWLHKRFKTRPPGEPAMYPK